MANCKLHFIKNLNEACYSGQDVSGVIVLHNESSRKIRGILMTVNGSAKTYWDYGLKQSAIWSRRYYSEERNMRIEIRLLGNGKGEFTTSKSPFDRHYLFTDQMDLSAGQHSMYFSFRLPSNVTSNFKHKQAGKIKYQFEVKLEQFLFSSSFKFPFKTVNHLDLNMEGDELMRLPLRGALSKKFFLDP